MSLSGNHPFLTLHKYSTDDHSNTVLVVFQLLIQVFCFLKNIIPFSCDESSILISVKIDVDNFSTPLFNIAISIKDIQYFKDCTKYL